MKPCPLDLQKNLTVPSLTASWILPDMEWVRVRLVMMSSGRRRPSGKGDPTRDVLGDPTALDGMDTGEVMAVGSRGQVISDLGLVCAVAVADRVACFLCGTSADTETFGPQKKLTSLFTLSPL